MSNCGRAIEFQNRETRRAALVYFFAPESLLRRFWGFGSCPRGIYDNRQTAVETVFIGKDGQFNRRFLRMCCHYLVEPTAGTPASGWEKGEVENQVGVVRERFFAPRGSIRNFVRRLGMIGAKEPDDATTQRTSHTRRRP
jgi:transposase